MKPPEGLKYELHGVKLPAWMTLIINDNERTSYVHHIDKCGDVMHTRDDGVSRFDKREDFKPLPEKEKLKSLDLAEFLVRGMAWGTFSTIDAFPTDSTGLYVGGQCYTFSVIKTWDFYHIPTKKQMTFDEVLEFLDKECP